MMDQGSVRNLEQIQEQDADSHGKRATSATIIVLGGACVLFAALALGGRRSAPAAAPADPLGDLLAQHGRAGPGSSAKVAELSPSDVTFPGLLSDDKNPTTALAAVRSIPNMTASPGLSDGIPVAAPMSAAAPPPPNDRLSVVPLPAQNVLEATPVITRPRDGLTKAASDSAQINSAGAPSSVAGHDGGYQLQVSSFRTQQEANDFADQLRARGHKAYVQEAHVTGRGTWFRVRVGPFASQHAAAAYRSGFETKEHVVPFIVPPSTKDAPAPPVATPATR
jgi:DedD protein